MKTLLDRLQELEAHLADAVAIMGTIPHTFTAEERALLQGLARMASIAAWNEAQVAQIGKTATEGTETTEKGHR